MSNSYYTFYNGEKVPKIGLGTWQSRPKEVYNAVLHALKSGYKHIDCAAIYRNEEEVGEAFTESFNKQYISREDLFVTSKLWCNSHKREDVIPALKQTLSDLKLDYLDLYLIHWPIAFKKGVIFPNTAEEMIPLNNLPIAETWLGMEEAVEMGLVKNIGVSNFSIKKLQDLLKQAKIKPVNNQVELHPYLQQNNLLEFCKTNKILLTAYSPLGSTPNPNETKPSLLNNDVIVKIANKHKVSTAGVLIAWGLHRNTIVIPKSVTPTRIDENLKALDIKLDEEDLKEIGGLDTNYRYVEGSSFALPGSSYTVKNIWDE